MTTHVLLVVHGVPPAACGGTETYVADLAQALARRPGVRVTVLAREGDPLRPELAVRRDTRGPVDLVLVNNTYQACRSFEETYRNPALRAAIAPLLDEIRPDVAHVHHLTGLSTELLEEFAARGIPIVATLNDYWLICHRGQLLDDRGRRCEGPGAGGCGSCIPAAALASPSAWRAGRWMRGIPALRTAAALIERAANAAPSRHRRMEASRDRAAHVREMCSHVDLFLAPSKTLLERYVAFGIPPAKLEWIDQGIDLAPFVARPPVPGARTGPLRVGFAGSLIPSKAPDVLLEAVARLPAGSVSLQLVGSAARYHGSDLYMRTLDRSLSRAPVSALGPVPHARMGERFDRLDVIVVPSIWIENAPFVIREAFASGVPVVASDLGGMAEMVRDGVDGLLFPAGDARGLASQLARLRDEPGLLQALRRGIRPMMSIGDDAAQLVARYQRFGRRQRAPSVAPSVRAGRRIAAVVLNYRTADQTWLAVRSIEASERRVDRIIVVDNGSADGSDERLRARCPRAEILQTGSNLGFSGGCNAGIRRALGGGADAVLLVNSDVVLAPDAIAQLETALDGNPAAGIAGPVVLSRREPDAIASAGMSFRASSGRMRHRAAGRALASLEPGPATVDAISGCAMLIGRDVFDRAGLFDDEYFFSYEDLDFCMRAARAGLSTVCVPAALAYHEGGASIGPRSPARIYYGVRNHLRVSERLFPLPPLATAARRAAILAFSSAYVALSPDVPIVSGMTSLTRGALDHLRGRYGAAAS